MKVSFLGAALAVLCLSSVPAISADTKPITLTVVTWGSESHPHNKFAQRFIKAAERESGGRLAFKYFPNGSMVKQGGVVTAVPKGTVDIALMIIDSWGGIEKDALVTSTPLWPLSMEEARAQLVEGKPIYDYFARMMKQNKTKLLCLFDAGPYVLASKFKLEKPEDLKGKVVRALSKGTAEGLIALSASPIVMSVGNVYTGLQTGTLDGAMNGIQGSIGLRYYEVADYELATGGVFGTLISGYIMNLKKFDSLPPELQAALLRAAKETREHTQDEFIQTYPDYLKEAESHGMKTHQLKKGTPEWDLWQTSLTDFRVKLRKQFSPELVKLLEP